MGRREFTQGWRAIRTPVNHADFTTLYGDGGGENSQLYIFEDNKQYRLLSMILMSLPYMVMGAEKFPYGKPVLF